MSASEYVFIRRITILLLNKDEAEVFQIPILLKGLFVIRNNIEYSLLMRTTLICLCLFVIQRSSSQELDIFQADSIYAKNRIAKRTMYSFQGKEKQKELITYYNAGGQTIKQYWYWNGEKQFHNVETFRYSDSGKLISIIDSSSDGNIEKTTFTYDNDVLKSRITVGHQNDTCDLRLYPNENTTIKWWYMDGKPYRCDTTIFERENVKLEYFGFDYSDNTKWHYNFSNQFDRNGSLVKVSAKVEGPNTSFTSYSYDNRNLLTKKQEHMSFNGKRSIQAEYNFEYE
jgi:hypothetical protein